jgi:hypothetical protein
MHVILGDRPFDNLYVLGLAYLSYEIPQPLRYLSVKNLLTVFGDPDHMVLEVIYGMRSFPVILHTLMLLKSSPIR